MALAALAVCFAGGSALADDGGVHVVDAWMRFVIAARPAAGYFTLKNDTDAARVLTGAASPACGMVMLHRSMSKDGSNAMVGVDSVNVAARGSVKFAPGGYHLMCMSPAGDMRSRKSVPVVLKFKDGSTVRADFRVEGPGGN